MTIDTVTGEIVTSDLTSGEARALTNRIKAAVEEAWALLLEAHERRAWTALGYHRWEDYVRGEFNMSRSYSYRLLDQAAVVRAIEAVSPMGDIELDERAARDLKPILPTVVERVRTVVDRLPQATPPVHVAEAVREVIAEARREVQQERDDRAAISKLNALAPVGFNPAADQERIEKTHAVFDAIAAIAAAASPADFLDLVAAQSLYRLDAVRVAADWLNDLADLLENK